MDVEIQRELPDRAIRLQPMLLPERLPATARDGQAPVSISLGTGVRPC